RSIDVRSVTELSVAVPAPAEYLTGRRDAARVATASSDGRERARRRHRDGRSTIQRRAVAQLAGGVLAPTARLPIDAEPACEVPAPAAGREGPAGDVDWNGTVARRAVAELAASI